jgi:hypothetical protein
MTKRCQQPFFVRREKIYVTYRSFFFLLSFLGLPGNLCTGRQASASSHQERAQHATHGYRGNNVSRYALLV